MSLEEGCHAVADKVAERLQGLYCPHLFVGDEAFPDPLELSEACVANWMANIMGVLHNNGGGGVCGPGPARAWGLASAQRSTPTARKVAFHCAASAGALWITSYADHPGVTRFFQPPSDAADRLRRAAIFKRRMMENGEDGAFHVNTLASSCLCFLFNSHSHQHIKTEGSFNTDVVVALDPAAFASDEEAAGMLYASGALLETSPEQQGEAMEEVQYARVHAATVQLAAAAQEHQAQGGRNDTGRERRFRSAVLAGAKAFVASFVDNDAGEAAAAELLLNDVTHDELIGALVAVVGAALEHGARPHAGELLRFAVRTHFEHVPRNAVDGAVLGRTREMVQRAPDDWQLYIACYLAVACRAVCEWLRALAVAGRLAGVRAKKRSRWVLQRPGDDISRMVVQAIQDARVCENAEAVDLLAACTRYPNVHLKLYAALPEAVLALLISRRDANGEPVDLGTIVALPNGRMSALNGEAFAVEFIDASESIRDRSGTLHEGIRHFYGPLGLVTPVIHAVEDMPEMPPTAETSIASAEDHMAALRRIEKERRLEEGARGEPMDLDNVDVDVMDIDGSDEEGGGANEEDDNDFAAGPWVLPAWAPPPPPGAADEEREDAPRELLPAFTPFKFPQPVLDRISVSPTSVPWPRGVCSVWGYVHEKWVARTLHASYYARDLVREAFASEGGEKASFVWAFSPDWRIHCGEAPQPPQLGTAPLPAAGPGHFGVTITCNGAVQRRFVLSVYVTGARPRRENKPSVSAVEIPKHRLMPRGGVSMVVDLSEEEPFYWLLSSERFCAACKSMCTGDNPRWRVDVSRGASLHASGLDVTYRNYIFPSTFAIPGWVEGFNGCLMVPADFGVAFPSTAPNPRAAVVARARHLLAFALDEDDAVPRDQSLNRNNSPLPLGSEEAERASPFTVYQEGRAAQAAARALTFPLTVRLAEILAPLGRTRLEHRPRVEKGLPYLDQMDPSCLTLYIEGGDDGATATAGGSAGAGTSASDTTTNAGGSGATSDHESTETDKASRVCLSIIGGVGWPLSWGYLGLGGRCRDRKHLAFADSPIMSDSTAQVLVAAVDSDGALVVAPMRALREYDANDSDPRLRLSTKPGCGRRPLRKDLYEAAHRFESDAEDEKQRADDLLRAILEAAKKNDVCRPSQVAL